MLKQFGNTWWGEQWLRSLSHIDYDNRLPRGKRYARNGSVKSIEIKDGLIMANVKGSQPRPYKDQIFVPQFDELKSKKFVDKLMKNPVAVAALMQRKLDPVVLDIAEECGLQVFPKKWSDFKMHCSCPDWAVPCKHLAAVVYKVADDIDNDPFLVFSLHGLDLMSELDKRGLRTFATENLNPPTLSSLVKAASKDRETSDPTPLMECDLSAIPSVSTELIELLPPSPPFWGLGDFRKTYSTALKVCSKDVAKRLKADIDRELPAPFSYDAEVLFKMKADCSIDAELDSMSRNSESISFDDFVERLTLLSPDDYSQYLPWVEVMHRVYLLAADLVVKGNVVPMIVKGQKDGYHILWHAAKMQPEVAKAVDAVIKAVPYEALLHSKKPVERGGEWLLNEIIRHLILSCEVKIEAGDPVSALFFRDTTYNFKGIGEQSTPGGIKAWTDTLSSISGDIKPVFIVDEVNDSSSFKISVDISDADFKATPLRDLLCGTNTESDLTLKVVGMLMSLSAQIPGLTEYIKDGAKSPFILKDEEFVQFLFSTIPLMRLLGLTVILPSSLKHILRPRVSMSIGAKGKSADSSKLRLDDLLNFEWTVAIGDNMLSREEFESLMITADRLVKFKGEYIYVNAADLEKIHKFFAKGSELKGHEILAVALAGEYEGAPVVLSKAAEEVLNELRNCPDIPVPTSLNAQLRPYQERGFQWMLHNLRAGFGSIIADDMGLGKTLQVISVLLYLKEAGELDKHNALVVVPTGLLTNWQSEIERFAPSLSSAIYHGSARNADNLDKDIILSSYGVVRTDLNLLKKHKWAVLVIDEAQNIKNSAAARTKAINAINATHRIAMSGTPVENRLSEFWSIMNFANKGYLGTMKSFASKYARPIQIENNRNVAKQFRAVTAPFMMRRLKSDKSIISDLPDKIERNEYASLTPGQAALYRKTLNAAMRTIEGVSGDDSKSLFKRQGLVLQMILALKQICDHPALFLKNEQCGIDLSGKAEMLVDRVQSIVESGEKVLIFTQFKEMGDILVRMIAEATGRQPLFYHGGCTIKQRTEMVERFQNVRTDQVFVLSLKAAGTGLNLTAASNVIHYDLWWNPAVEAQATDRAYRIGQNKNVLVTRYITKGTFEERIDEMISEKKMLADLTVESGESWISKMSNAELKKLFSL